MMNPLMPKGVEHDITYGDDEFLKFREEPSDAARR